MFQREHHRRIARVLEQLDGPKLESRSCLFGGGTAITLRYGEYRESVDIDLLVSDRAGYRQMREWLTGAAGLEAITRASPDFRAVREIRADQYGVRTLLELDGVEIKFEVVLEGRIEFERPGPTDRICGVATLTPLDMAASKLLANSDRWADDSVASRDLIDLAMMVPPRELLDAAIAKASGAYGEAITRDLDSAIDALGRRPQRLDSCMQRLRISTVPKALLWQRIKALRS